MLVDDQRSYCDSATALGMDAVRIDRRDGTGDVDTLAGLSGRFAPAT